MLFVLLKLLLFIVVDVAFVIVVSVFAVVAVSVAAIVAITFMQNVYHHTLGTNYVSTVYSAAAFLWLQYVWDM